MNQIVRLPGLSLAMTSEGPAATPNLSLRPRAGSTTKTSSTRSAIVASILLHASLVFSVGWQWSSGGGGIASGESGTDSPFFASAAPSGCLSDPTAPAQPEPDGNPQFTEPAFLPPAPAVVFSTPPICAVSASFDPLPSVIAAPPAMPAVTLRACAAMTAKVKHRATARLGGHSGTPGGSSGAGAGNGSGSADYVPPQFRVRYKPPYPEAARAQRLEGTVLLLVSIDASGRVTSASVQSGCGHAVLDLAALAAVRSWRFDPARQAGLPVASQVQVPVRFRFEERG